MSDEKYDGGAEFAAWEKATDRKFRRLAPYLIVGAITLAGAVAAFMERGLA